MQSSKRSSAMSQKASTGKKPKIAASAAAVDQRKFPACWGRPFPVNGQGVLVFNTDRKGLPFYVSVESEDGDYWMALHVGKGYAAFLRHGKGDAAPTQLVKGDGEVYGVEEGKQTYWYSYDRDNLVLKYGKGYRMKETTLMEYDFLVPGQKHPEKARKDWSPYFNAEGPKYVRQYDEISNMLLYSQGIQVTEPMVEFDKQPLVRNIPPKVLDSSKVTMFELDRGDFVFSASLPAACKELYENIKGCELDYSENVQGEKVLFSDAIRFSIYNGILRDKLAEKKSEFGHLEINETYLRVTLGRSLGKSPGIPYVLEIWPAGHYSPVHNHGNANCVIKVLYGSSLLVNIYNKQTGKDNVVPAPLSTFDVCKNDVVWIDRNWYQTHKLENKGTDYCATIQCYAYAASDTTYWPYFDYISDDETIAEFYPSSDFEFIAMRTKVMAEYTDYVLGIPRKGV